MFQSRRSSTPARAATTEPAPQGVLRSLEEAPAAWRSDYDSPAYREGRPRLAWLGSVIRRLAADAEVRTEAAADYPGQRRRRTKRTDQCT